MTSKPYPGNPEVLPAYAGDVNSVTRVCGCSVHGGTVFATWAKSRWAWDFKARKPLAFWTSRDAHYANYCYRRRMRRIWKNQKWLRLVLVGSHSPRNECISVPLRNPEPVEALSS